MVAEAVLKERGSSINRITKINSNFQAYSFSAAGITGEEWIILQASSVEAFAVSCST